jgi:phage shock protein E
VSELDPDADYVVSCRSGNRSAAAIDRMTDLGFTSLVNGGGLDQAAEATGIDFVD